MSHEFFGKTCGDSKWIELCSFWHGTGVKNGDDGYLMGYFQAIMGIKATKIRR